jgi:hypothetical protein
MILRNRDRIDVPSTEVEPDVDWAYADRKAIRMTDDTLTAKAIRAFAFDAWAEPAELGG